MAGSSEKTEKIMNLVSKARDIEKENNAVNVPSSSKKMRRGTNEENMLIAGSKKSTLTKDHGKETSNKITDSSENESDCIDIAVKDHEGMSTGEEKEDVVEPLFCDDDATNRDESLRSQYENFEYGDLSTDFLKVVHYISS